LLAGFYNGILRLVTALLIYCLVGSVAEPAAA